MPNNSTPTTRTFMTQKNGNEGDKVQPPKPPRSKRFTRKNLPWILILVLLVVCTFLFWQYQQARHKLDGSANENAKIQKDVENLVYISDQETPTIATVNDATKLKNQAFFKDAQNGDKVLIYTKLHKAILYRPSTHMLINVQTVNLTQSNTPNVIP